ncbi:MAG: putative secreted protein [Frankiales bacterium]|nr:putative secreted protein [Frankiales bacterium]
MSRRGLTLLLASLLAVGMTAAAAVAKVPYVALGPGPAYDTLGSVQGTPVITVRGRATYPTKGALDLTTVGVVPQLTLAEALKDWFDDSLAVVPREVIYPPDQSDAQVDAENSQAMQTSQDSATTAALRQLGIPITTEVVVADIAAGAPATGKLQAGDVVTAVDGAAVRDGKALRAAVSAVRPGDAVSIAFTRAGKPSTVSITTGTATGEPAPRAVIGVEPQDRADYPFDVTISLREVGGPSAGLMFALGLIDKLEPADLTGGRHVAGTGEITPEGVVGPIGGIPQKLLGARKKGATVFLTPAQNCEEALGALPDGLQLVRVTTLKDALQGLRVLRDGGKPAGCAPTASAAAK